MRPRLLPLAAAALAASCASAPPVDPDLAVRTRYLMGTLCTIELPASPAAADHAEAAFAEMERIERLLSTWRDDSALARINAAPAGTPVAVPPELAHLLTRTLALSAETDGAFSPLAGVLVRLWDLRGAGRIPPPDEVADAAAAISETATRIDLAASTVTRATGATFEEGGFGKGYALDRALALLRERGVPRASIDFGGQLARYGFAAPSPVAIAHPERREEAFLEIRFGNGSVSTSSGSERTFAGGRHSHILDPRTGLALPPRGSVTVVDESAFVADALSTALYVMGSSAGVTWADERGIAALWLIPDASSYRVVASRAARTLLPEPNSTR